MNDTIAVELMVWCKEHTRTWCPGLSPVSTVCGLFFNQSRDPCPACSLKMEESAMKWWRWIYILKGWVPSMQKRLFVLSFGEIVWEGGSVLLCPPHPHPTLRLLCTAFWCQEEKPSLAFCEQSVALFVGQQGWRLDQLVPGPVSWTLMPLDSQQIELECGALSSVLSVPAWGQGLVTEPSQDGPDVWPELPV